MKLINHFTWFMADTVNLNQSRIDKLDDRFEKMRKFLIEESAVGSEFIPQGSYAHKLIIKPQGNRDFDVDGLILMEEQPGWSPAQYLDALQEAFNGHTFYGPASTYRTRCVTINYADDFHIDVVPYLVIDGKHYIVNADEDEFENTNPVGFSAWVEERRRITGGHYAEVVRLFKHLRDFKGTFTAKSVLLNTLLGGVVSDDKVAADFGYYVDLPTALLHIVSDLDDYLQDNPTMPRIEDPSCPDLTFNHRWDEDQYRNFRACVHRYAEWIATAYHEPDEAASVEAWQELFGDKFTQPPAAELVALENLRVATGEQYITDEYPYAAHVARLDIVGVADKKRGFRHGDLPGLGNKVGKGRTLTFELRNCPIAEPYEVFWKVRNHGEEAAEEGQLRGQLMPDSGSRRYQDWTAYRGTHHVDCYVVKDRRCVATGRQEVVVANW